MSEDSFKENFDNGNGTLVDIALTLHIRLSLTDRSICNINDFRKKVFLENGPHSVGTVHTPDVHFSDEEGMEQERHISLLYLHTTTKE